MEITNRKKQAMTTKKRLLYTAYELIREEGYPAFTIRRLCEKSGVSTGAFYHHYTSKEDLIAQGFASYDEKLTEFLDTYQEKDPIKAIRSIVLSLNQYIFDNGAPFAKELYISQLSIKDSYITRKDRSYVQAVLRFVGQAKDTGLIRSPMSAEEITDFLLRIGRGTILDWCLHDYSYDLMEQSAKDLDFVLDRLTA